MPVRSRCWRASCSARPKPSKPTWISPLHPIDGYLLDGRPSKAEAVAAVLADRQPVAAAQAFYRALDALGPKVADEALIALRLALSEQPVDDDGVRRLRSLLAGARGGDAGARAEYLAAVATG